ncbi:autotransporter-associated beta strand repeat-containing protein [Verrucomicrobium sp. BvORR106]|uniref:beta strand repeat-containing protein n=1 Tax=Verrucomicrobium sp. BvORR106 TaxID=1403819 RepID=UPI000571E127|nr:autotransporter-associated beta strand repeat-containing protein [Verrucomicrobium sp. BvORR106]
MKPVFAFLPVLAGASLLLGLPSRAPGQYFDGGSAAGLNPAPAAVEWSGAYWQSVFNPGAVAPGAWVDGFDAYFQTGGTNLVNVTGSITVYDLLQSVTGTATSIGGTGNLLLTGDSVANSSTSALQFLDGLTVTVDKAGANQVWNTDGGDIVVNAVLAGSAGSAIGGGGLLKTGSGTLYLNKANTFDGYIVLAEGTLEVGNAAALGVGTSRLVFNGGTFRYATGITEDFSDQFDPFTGDATVDTNGGNITFATALTGNGGFTKKGAGTLTLGAAATYTGTTTVEAGVLKIASGAIASALGASTSVIVASGATLDTNSNTGTGTKYDITVSGSGVAGMAALWNSGAGATNSSIWKKITLAGDTTIGGVNRYDIVGAIDFIGGTYTLTKVGANQLTWSPNNGSTVGDIVISGGNVTVQNGNVGSTAHRFIVNSAGTLSSWQVASNGKQVEMNGGVWTSSGSGAATTIIWSGMVHIDNVANNRINPGTDRHMKLTGQVTGAGGFTANGGGILYLVNGTNNFSGGLTLASGTVQLSDGTLNGTLGSTSNAITVNGGALDLHGTTQTIGALSGTAGFIQNSRASTTSVLKAGNGGADASYAGVIRDNSGTGGVMSFEKVGAGRQILTAVHTYTGTTTVSGGVLQIGSGTAAASTARAGAGNVTVAATGRLSGNGGIGSSGSLTTVAAGGFLSVGTFDATGAQSLLVNGAFTNLGTIEMDVWTYGVGAGTTSDTLVFGSDAMVDLGGTLVLTNLTGNTTWALGDSIRLFDWTAVTTASNRNVAFSSVDMSSFGTLAAGWQWDLSRLSDLGVVSLVKDVLTGALRWDANTGSTGAQDGSGVWNSSTSNWWNGSANAPFTNGNSVVFGAGSGPAGTVQVAASGVSVQDITFEPAGSGSYQINGPGAITLQSSSWITTNVDASINAVLTGSGSGFTKAGAGRLTLTAANTYTGTTTLYQGVLAIENTRALGAGGAGAIVFNGGTLEYGRGIVLDYSSRFGTIGAGGAVVDTNGNNITFAGVLAGSGSFTKTGEGRLYLSGDSAAYDGKIIVEEGILALGHANAAGVGTTTANGLDVRNGATLDLSFMGGTTPLNNERITASGQGVGYLGAVMKNGGSGLVINQFVLTGHTTLNANVRWDFDGVMDAQGFSVTKIGSADLPWEGGANSRNLGNAYVKQGTFNFSGGSDMGYFDSIVYGNTISVNSGASLSFYAKSSDDKRITLQGGIMRRNGGAVGESAGAILRVTGGLNLTAGHSSIQHGNSQLVFQLGTITRGTGATLDIQDTSALVLPTTGNPVLATTTSTNSNGILGGYLTYGGNTWAVNSTNGVNGAIAGLATASYSNTFAAAANVDVLASEAISNFAVNSLRFNTAAATTLTLTGANTLQSGGILVTSAVGNNALSITGGSLRGSASGELIIHQNNTANSLTIGSVIENNGGATALVKTGGGTLILAATNTYTGHTYINGAAGGGSTGVLQVSQLQTTGNDQLGSTANQIYFNNGILRYAGASSTELGRTVNLLSGGGTFDVLTAGVALNVSGKITGEALAADEGHYAGQGNLTKTGNGILILSNGSNDYTGTTTVNAGILRLSGAGRLGASIARLTVNTGGILELNGTSQNVGLLMGSGGIIRNGGIGASKLTIGHDDATYVANGTQWGTGNGYAGIIEDGTGGGTTSLAKTGVGYQILSGSSTYTGTTEVLAGTLQVGAGTAAGSLATARTGSGLHTVSSGATLAGNGVIGGDTIIQAGGLLSVGNFGQTAAQILTFNGGLSSQGTISMDVWSVSSVDQIKFAGTSPVELGGKLILNNGNAALQWQVNESLRLIDWGVVSVVDRDLDSLLLDLASLGLTNSAGTYWDTSRLKVNGTIVVLANALTWDSDTATTGAQDGAGTWTTDTHWWNGTGNSSFVSDGTQNVIFGAASGAAGTVTINATGGILVNNMTFNDAGSGYYTIAGTGADGTLTVTNNAWITTNHAYVDSLGTTISAVMAGSGAWTKSGVGRLILSGANTFTGAVTVAQGVLDIRNATALGTTAGNTTVMAGATLEVRGGITVAENLVLNGSGHRIGVDALGAIRNQSGNNTFSGAISLASTSQVTSRDGVLTLSGIISGAGGLVVTGEGPGSVVVLQGSGSNTYTGATNINSGILRLNKNQYVNAIAANTQVNIGDGQGGSQDILRLAQHDQIADAGTVLNFRGTGSQAGTLQLFGFNETVGSIRSINGEGIIENGNNGTSTLTVNNATNDVFSGILRNNGGILALTKINSGILTLTGASTYSGATTVRAGVLELAGSGSLGSTGQIVITTGGTLRLTNSAASNSSNRINDGAAVSLTGARLEFTHDGGAASYSETAGDLVLESGASTVATSRAADGQSSMLRFASLSRNNSATVDFSGAGLGLDDGRNQVVFDAPPASLDHGLIGAWVTVGDEFAKYGSRGVTALTVDDYAIGTADSTWTFVQNIKQAGGFTLGADRVINSLNLAQQSAATVNLGGHTLRIESGGLLVSGDFDSEIGGGTLTAGTSADSRGELVIHQNSTGRTLNVTASIANNGTGQVALTKSGAGTLVLSAANTFTGGLTVNAGTVRLNHADALADGNRLAVEAGTLDLNGHSISVSQLSSAATATAGVITNNGTTPTVITVGAEGQSSAFYGVLQNGTGVLALTKAGTGSLTLGGNSTYTGITNVEGGKLIVASSGALGNTAAGSNTIVKSGATIEFAAEGVYNEFISIEGEGVNRQGALALANVATLRGGADQVRVMNLVLTGDATINNASKRLDLDGSLQGNGHALTKIGSSQVTYEGGQTTNLGDIFVKQGDFTFGGGTGALGDSTKTVYVNSGATFRFYNVSSPSKNITLRGGTWVRDGSGNQVTPNVFRVTNGLKLEAGASAIAHQNTNQVIHLETIQRSAGATLNITNSSAAPITTDSLNSNGIIGGYLTWGGNTWAVSGESGSDITISGLASGSYQVNNFGSASNNVDVTSSQSPAAGFTVNTLRFNAAAAVTLTLQGTNTVSSGGILITSAVAGNASKITGGTLVGSAGAGGELIIHQNNTGSAFTIESVIANNGLSNTALTKAGAGRLVLTGNNTYGGGTYITGATGGGTRGVLAVSKISDTGDSNLGQSSGGSNGLYFNNGTLEYSGSANATTGRKVELLSGGGEINVTNGAASLTLSGVISNPVTSAEGGFYASEHALTKSGSGTLVFSGSGANTYTGDTTINGGVLLLMKTAGVNAISGGITVNSNGILRLGASHQIQDSSIVTLAGSGRWDLNGESETVGGLSGTLGTVGNDGGAPSAVTVKVADGQTATYGGTIEDGASGTGGLSLVKEGAGTQVLTGTNTLSGSTTISQGTLEVGTGGSLMYSNVGIADEGRLHVSSESDTEFYGEITGEGTMVKSGAGATTLWNTVALSGGVTVTQGAVFFNQTAYYDGLDDNPVVQAIGGRIGGYGTVNANVVVKESGVINAGDSDISKFGLLTIEGSLDLKRGAVSGSPRAIFEISASGGFYRDGSFAIDPSIYDDLGGYLAGLDFENDFGGGSLFNYNISTHDQILLFGDLTLEAGAIIVVDNSDGYSFQEGDMLDLMNWATLHNNGWDVNADLLLPTLAEGLHWDRSLFLSEGVLVVVAPEPGRALLLFTGLMLMMARRRRR